MKQTASISKCKSRGVSLWRVRWHDAGKIRRKFFAARASAEAHAAHVRGEAVGIKQLLAAVPQADQEKLIMIYNESLRLNVDLLTFLSARVEKLTGPALADVTTEMLAAKKESGRSARYIYTLNLTLARFAAGRERLPISQIGFQDVASFLASKETRSRPTYRAHISTLLQFAFRRNYRLDNPCSKLEPVKLSHLTPGILSLSEIKTCLAWLVVNPRSLAWFALSTFAGLRPEEAEKISWAEINFAEGWICLDAKITKTGQRRVVYPNPMALAWLQKASQLESNLPLSADQRRTDRQRMLKTLGWGHWKKDCTRHTCASMWLAHSGSAATVATALGHSESILKKHYLALVTQKQAQEFWSITPESISPAPTCSPSAKL